MVGVKGRGGRPPKPSAVLKQDGGYREDRHGSRIDSSPTKGAPVKPEGFTLRQSQMWDAVVNQLPKELLGDIDTAALTELCVIHGYMTACQAVLNDDPTNKDARCSYCGYHDRWLRLAQEFGLTPSARARLKVPETSAEDEDPFQALIDKHSGAN